MLSSCFSTNSAFETIPDDTNAVESHNRVSKGTTPDILKVAMLTTYKVDMSAALEHLAQIKNIPTVSPDSQVFCLIRCQLSFSLLRSAITHVCVSAVQDPLNIVPFDLIYLRRPCPLRGETNLLIHSFYYLFCYLFCKYFAYILNLFFLVLTFLQVCTCI